MSAEGRNAIDGQRVLVTGGSGFIGSNLIDLLEHSTDSIVNLDVAPPQDGRQQRWWRPCDVCAADLVLKEFRAFRPDVVVHLAARTDLHGATVADYAANTTGVDAVVRAVQAVGTASVAVFASSRLVFEIHHKPAHQYDYRPTTAYGASKVVGEQIVLKSHGVNWILVRPTSIWGPWFSVPYRGFFDAVLSNRYVHPRGRRIMKSYGFVVNSATQILRLAEAQEAVGRVFWLADYQPLDVLEWAETIQQVGGSRPVRNVPLSALRLAAGVGDGLKKVGMREPPLTRFRLDNLLTDMVYDTSELEALTGPLRYSMRRGVETTIEWMRTGRAVGI
jgi:nucleoside-diphosphate-sugar epimerase